MSRPFRIAKFVSRITASVLLWLPAVLFAAGAVVTDPTGVAPDRYVY